ncbi:Proteinaceous RNase P 3 [Linum perenne]
MAASQRKKPKNQSLEAQFNYNLNSYSKSKDLRSALSLYDSAAGDSSVRLNQHHFNTLLYLCSVSLTAADPSTKDLALEHGFQIYDRMASTGIKPNEASITAVARLAAARNNGDYAFELVKNMISEQNSPPRLRTYDPALFCFCDKLEADKAFEVEEHMGRNGISLEEAELAALLKVSSASGKEGKVYEYLHKLRNTVRCVREETADVIRNWFERFEGNGNEMDLGLTREAIARNGGGWHGLGWIGKGGWIVNRGKVGDGGKCFCCGEQLACADIAEEETDRFAESVAGFAMDREVRANFSEFQDWLKMHADYDAIVDAANVGLYQQNFSEGGFSVSQVVNLAIEEQLHAVVTELYNKSGKKWPLIVLHSKRVRALLENASHRKFIEEWKENGALYTTPHGSNDDWYWLYAAVKLRCLLVTNDEMRDHIFEILGTSFFLKWKERHQAKYTFTKGNLFLQMPAPFSVSIQESEKGSWHVPIVGNGSNMEAESWLCITWTGSAEKTLKESVTMEGFENGQDRCSNGGVAISESPSTSAAITGKRKERSPCHS